MTIDLSLSEGVKSDLSDTVRWLKRQSYSPCVMASAVSY